MNDLANKLIEVPDHIKAVCCVYNGCPDALEGTMTKVESKETVWKLIEVPVHLKAVHCVYNGSRADRYAKQMLFAFVKA